MKMREIINLVEGIGGDIPALLYHGTGAREWVQIQQTDELCRAEWRLGLNEPYGISLTDSESVARVFAAGRSNPDAGEVGVILVLDGHKLAARFEIEPYEDPRVFRDEREWRLFGDIKPLSDYLVRVTS